MSDSSIQRIESHDPAMSIESHDPAVTIKKTIRFNKYLLLLGKDDALGCAGTVFFGIMLLGRGLGSSGPEMRGVQKK